ncbi:serine/threonine protein kinase [Actinospica sp. MGRD01-02]|uniref:non-specific serine/threonine protein kinase n=1 Tax=Actinospica acidithermotolerans TaxID=2828514 RepID=A0A941E7T3_9ACTN|nr:serine/threonine-protein kinase [Actinospica acidithermotolerans]MBR7825025.1 serine/threonine protein kinase [Actinospica acidithermotolerans]
MTAADLAHRIEEEGGFPARWTRWERGRLVSGRYRLLRPLGSGGTAHVWAARDEALGREVAVKALSRVAGEGGGHERERLEREARLLAGLRHPLIVTVFDFVESDEGDENGDGCPFLVTELLSGESLGSRLKRGPISTSEALTVCGQVADALATAHASGVVHRDVKPGNVMLTARGAVLLDFGISRRATDADLTGQVVIGTPACMAPEQWRGSPAQPASDVYALGCLLYWCLSGHAPYPDRELPALGMSHLLSDPPALPLTGGRRTEIDALYQACARKDPNDRPSAREVAGAFASLGPSASAASSAASVATTAAAADDEDLTRPVHRPRRRTRLAVSLAAAGAALAASIVVPLSQTDESPTASTKTVSPRPSTPSGQISPGNSKISVNAAATASSTAAGAGTTAAGSGSTAAAPAAAPAAAAAANSGRNGHGHGRGHGKHGG